MKANDKALGRGMLLAFSLPGAMQGFMHAPENLIQGIYAKHAGLSLAALAAAMLLTRLFDAVTYPLIGYLSDLTARRNGSRKGWIALGSAVTAVGLWFLYRPPADVGVVYFTTWFTVTYFGWKLTEIPYAAWSLMLSTDYAQRSRIQLWRGLATLIGLLLFYVALYIAKAAGYSADTEISFHNLALIAVIIAIGVPLLNGWSLYSVPKGEVPPPPPVSTLTRRQQAALLWRSIVGNGPLLHFLGAITPLMFLLGISTGAQYLFIDTYLGMSKQLAGLLLLMGPTTLLSIPFWGWLAIRYERHRVLAVAIGLYALLNSGMAFVPTGEAGLIPVALLSSAVVFCIGATLVIPMAMLGDIADFGRLKSNQDHSGIYASFLTFAIKSLGGLGAGISLAALGWFGFDAQATQQTAMGTFGIKLTYVWLAVAGGVIAAPLLWTFPINRARQQQIHEELARRDAAVMAAATTS
jgi:GPH family glycoside/pentoside/hexuronide:cation symporter